MSVFLSVLFLGPAVTKAMHKYNANHHRHEQIYKGICGGSYGHLSDRIFDWIRESVLWCPCLSCERPLTSHYQSRLPLCPAWAEEQAGLWIAGGRRGPSFILSVGVLHCWSHRCPMTVYGHRHLAKWLVPSFTVYDQHFMQQESCKWFCHRS